MSTFTQTLYQIVFSTKYRTPTLLKEKRQFLYQDMWGILKNKNCHLYRINGVEDHVHIVTSIHPTVSIASLVKDIKLGASAFIKQHRHFPDFGGWQDGYAAFTYSIKEKDALIEYVKNQEEHHRKLTFREELIQLLQEHVIEFDEKYLD